LLRAPSPVLPQISFSNLCLATHWRPKDVAAPLRKPHSRGIGDLKGRVNVSGRTSKPSTVRLTFVIIGHRLLPPSPQSLLERSSAACSSLFSLQVSQLPDSFSTVNSFHRILNLSPFVNTATANVLTYQRHPLSGS
jgi:hypothetical protein